MALGLLAGLTGCGGFSGGNSPGLEAPPAPDFANPDRQGEVKGQVKVGARFLPVLAAATRKPDQQGHAAAADVYRSIVVRLLGTRRSRETDLEGDGTCVLEKLPGGDYRCRVELGAQLLAEFPLVVTPRETLEFDLEVLGYDLADLDADKSTRDLLTRLEVKPGGAHAPTRVVYPDGSVRARLGNGGTEYLLPGGVVRREAPGHGATFRADHDLDGVPDGDDPDYRRLRPKPTAPGDEDLLLGTAFPPLVRDARSGPADGATGGDLMLFEAEVAQDFAAEPARVTAYLYGEGTPTWSFDLHDDGGAQDMLPDWPGHQPSGDRVKGDGVFAHVLPVDVTTRDLLDGRLVVVEAADTGERRSNRFAYFLDRLDRRDPLAVPGEGRPAGEPAPGPRTGKDPWTGLKGIEFLGRKGSGGAEVSARFQAAPALAGLVATLVGPSGFRRVFAPGDAGPIGGWLGYRTLPATLTGDGIYYIVLGVPDGRIFYAGSVLSAKDIPTSRTGG